MTTYQIKGTHHIGYQRSQSSDESTFVAVDPINGTTHSTLFYSAGKSSVDAACRLAEKAFSDYSQSSIEQRIAFLSLIAEKLSASGDFLVELIKSETGLPSPRIIGERMRTINQIKLFIQLLKDGHWVEARIDTALPKRTPIPRPDIRSMKMAIGPVVVFGAGNFPLAFSTAGGDTISALASGCPVIVKGHPAHPHTSEFVAELIIQSAKETNCPEGVFSHLHSNTHDTGKWLVQQSAISSVAFTGSKKGGLAIHAMAQQRENPIPVFAEMGSINPVFVLSDYAEKNMDSVIGQLADSVLQGVGQFCTKPGLIILPPTASAPSLKGKLINEILNRQASALLYEGIRIGFDQGVLERKGDAKTHHHPGYPTTLHPVVSEVTAKEFCEKPSLLEEIFGPYSLLISTESTEDYLSILHALNGQLTLTLFGTDSDLQSISHIFVLMTQKTGRIVINGVPTGVEVSDAIQHGGPFPATTDPRFTSVGSRAVERFIRPVSYQNVPNHLLPLELKNENPLHIWRMVNGTYTLDGV